MSRVDSVPAPYKRKITPYIRTPKCRAIQVVIVPESQETIASDFNLLPIPHATTCGFIGESIHVWRVLPSGLFCIPRGNTAI
jgi:hypothetical protein